MLNRQSCQKTVDRLQVKRRRKIFDHDSLARRDPIESDRDRPFLYFSTFLSIWLVFVRGRTKRRPGHLGSLRLSPISGYPILVPPFPIPYNIIIRLMESSSLFSSVIDSPTPKDDFQRLPNTCFAFFTLSYIMSILSIDRVFAYFDTNTQMQLHL